VAGLKARGHRNALALEGPEDLAGLVGGLARPGDYVVCLGAGNITQWGPTRCRTSCRRLRTGRRDVPRHHPRSQGSGARSARAADPNASLADVTWFRVGGPAQVLFSPTDEEDLGLFPGPPAARHPRDRHRPRLEPHRARRRCAGRGDPPRRQGLRHGRGRGGAPHPGRHGGSGREGRPRGRGRRHRRARVLSAAFRARSAGRCA
jgi:hypothetical protein